MIKNILNKKEINYSVMLFLFSILILNTYILISITTNNHKKDNIFRLHVVANSNSIDDQITKLKVETKIKEYFNEIAYNDSDNIYDILNSNSKNILEISNNVLNNENKDYTSKLDIGKIYYEEKENVMYSMPEGTYNSARLVLGAGNGKNIWTIIFPNKETVKSISELDTILPGIKNIYEEDVSIKDIKDYDFKIKEILKNIQKHLKL